METATNWMVVVFNKIRMYSPRVVWVPWHLTLGNMTIDFKVWPWPWTQLVVTCALNKISIWLSFVVGDFKSSSSGSRIVESGHAYYVGVLVMTGDLWPFTTWTLIYGRHKNLMYINATKDCEGYPIIDINEDLLWQLTVSGRSPYPSSHVQWNSPSVLLHDISHGPSPELLAHSSISEMKYRMGCWSETDSSNISKYLLLLSLEKLVNLTMLINTISNDANWWRII